MSRAKVTLQSLTDDILAEVDAAEAQEKTASAPAITLETEVGQELQKFAQELRQTAKRSTLPTYEDLTKFAHDRGLLTALKSLRRAS